jgi:uncharacterized protein
VIPDARTPPSIGHGIGLRPQHYAQLLRDGARGVAWMEIISENLFCPGGRPWAVVERVRRDVPVVLHGVALGIGNVDPLSTSYLRQLRSVIERVEPAWVSDHLCWGAYGGHHAHDLLPLPHTAETIAHVAARVHAVQDCLGRRILLENVSAYLAYADADLTECEVINEIASRTGCGLLVDLNNVIVCAHNLGLDAERYLDAIDPWHVGQLHLAGHTRQGDVLIDTHVGPTPEIVWRLYRRALRRFGRVPTLVEWDEDVPALEIVLAEAAAAARIEREVLGD